MLIVPLLGEEATVLETMPGTALPTATPTCCAASSGDSGPGAFDRVLTRMNAMRLCQGRPTRVGPLSAASSHGRATAWNGEPESRA